MASLSGVNRSNGNYLSSLMNSANTITGLASGLDTESMIENLVKSYQAKITQFNQKITKVEWKQDAYRSIISQLSSLSNKYTSYTSSTNLMSKSFFTNSVKVSTLGKFADAVTASGKTSSDISLNSVKQLATAAQYRTKSNLISDDTGTISGKETDLFSEDSIELSNLSGSLTLTYGSQTISLSFDETSDVEAMNDIRRKLGDGASDAEVLAELINQKLADKKINFTNGNSESADQRIKATANGDKISFSELKNGGNGVYISGASGNIANQLGLKSSDLKNAASKKITSTGKVKELTHTMSGIEYLAEKSNGSNGGTMNIRLDGTTKSITLPKVEIVEEEISNPSLEEGEDGELKDTASQTVKRYFINGEEVNEEDFADKYTEALKKSVKDAFGDKVRVENKGEDGSLQLEFKVKNEGSELVINSSVGDALGIGNTATSYLNTSKTLGDLWKDGTDEEGGLKGLTAVQEKDENGNLVDKVDEKGNKLYEFKINDVVVGTYTKNTKLSDLMNDINNSDAGVKVAYSQTSQNFTFTAKETGADSKVEMGDGLAKAMFGAPDVRESKASDTFKGLDLEESGSQRVVVEVQGGQYAFNITSEMTTQDIIDEINSSPFSAFGYEAFYDDATGRIAMKDDTGNDLDIKISKAHHVGDPIYGDDVIDGELEYANTSNISYTEGQNAIFNVTINGETMDMTRSSNTVNIDGLSITMKDTFTAENSSEAVTFKSSTDSDKIMDAIKTMVAEYNAVMAEIKSAYGTMPYQSSNGSFTSYEPLTDEDMEGMSESAIARYEEKAKQGILFGDRTLSTLYSKMNEVFSFSNTADVDTLKDMGISINFNSSDGSQAVTIDEEKLRAMLDSDPDRVANLFTKTDGIMDRMKTQLDTYAKTTGEPKGILVQQAGTPLSSLSLMSNNWQSEIDNYNKQIERWQTKLESQVERYTSQFARLEQLINQMNSQSSALAGLMGG